MTIPIATPAAIIKRFMGERALIKPAPIKDKVSSILLPPLLFQCLHDRADRKLDPQELLESEIDQSNDHHD